MKSYFISTSMLFCSLFSLPLSAAQTQAVAPSLLDQGPKLISLVAHNIFAPPGFDDNDNAQLVLEVYLPSTCYKSAPPLTRVDRVNHKIYVEAQAYEYSGTGCWCLELFTPYIRTVDLGILPHGSYDILELDANGVSTRRGNMPVAVAKTPSPDDFLYAPVRQATIDKSSGKTILSLSGTFSSDCMYLQKVKVLTRAPHIIEVLPIANYKSENCKPGAVPFETHTALPSIDPGSTLIHVRSLNGQSVNLVEDL